MSNIATSGGVSVLTLMNERTSDHNWANDEEVIVIQMQDNVLGDVTNTGLFGGLLSSGIGNAGAYELAKVTTYSSGIMTLNRKLTRPFNTGSNASVQVVSFTSLGSGNVTTTDDITAIPWNGTLGRGV